MSARPEADPKAASPEGESWFGLVDQAVHRAKSVDDEYNIVYGAKKSASEAYQKAKQIDEKHRVVEKTRNAILAAVAKAKEWDEQHKVADRSKKAAKTTVKTARDMDEQHRIIERTKKAAVSFVQSVRELDERHKLTETTSREVARAMDTLRTDDSRHAEEEVDIETLINDAIDSQKYCDVREEHYKKELDEVTEEAKVKKAGGDEKGALVALKRKCLYENELENIQNTRRLIDIHLLNLLNATDHRRDVQTARDKKQDFS